MMRLSELHYIQLLDEARQEILTKGNNAAHYLKEIESRLTAVDNLRCCGNCKHYTPRGDCLSKHGYNPHYYCDMWQPDGLTRDERIKI